MPAKKNSVLTIIKNVDARVRLSVEESPAFFMTLALAMLIVLFFRNIVTLLLEGLFFASVALLVFFAAFIVWLKASYGKPTMVQLLARKNRVVDSLMIARQKYMKRKLNEKEFNRFFVQKQRQLIELEARMAQIEDKRHSSDVSSQVSKVSAKKRHVLRNFLDEKKRLVKELEIAETSYLKRKINAGAYQELVQTNQEKLIEIEAEIKSLHREDSVSKVMDNLKRGLPKPKKGRTFVRRKKLDLELLSDEVSDQAVKKK